MNNFVFENQTKVYFGKGAVAEHLEKILLNYGKNVMIGYGGGSIKKNGAYDDVMAALKATGKNVIEFSGIMPNPTLDYMRQGAKLARENNVDLIIAVGGGSTMDCCKAIAVQAVYDGDIWNDFYINPGNMDFDPVPFGVVVTMPATGSEVNGAGVLTNTEDMIKTDRDYVKMNPLFAVMDPMYTLTLPKRQMLAGAFDILSHIMETYFSFPIEDNVSDDVSEALFVTSVLPQKTRWITTHEAILCGNPPWQKTVLLKWVNPKTSNVTTSSTSSPHTAELHTAKALPFFTLLTIATSAKQVRGNSRSLP